MLYTLADCLLKSWPWQEVLKLHQPHRHARGQEKLVVLVVPECSDLISFRPEHAHDTHGDRICKFVVALSFIVVRCTAFVFPFVPGF